MTLPLVLLIVFVVAVLVSLPVARKLTTVTITKNRYEGSRHWSASDIPRIGGVAVFATIPLALMVAAFANATLQRDLPKFPQLSVALVVASAILFFVGLRDDIRGVRPLAKVTAQTVAALAVYFAGFSVSQVSFFPGSTLSLGWTALPITVFWLVGVSNAFNLIDGLDGLAGGVAVIALVATTAAAIFFGNVGIPVFTVALIGGLLGFLNYNVPKARLFMGDSGSLVVGFLLAFLSVKGSTDGGGVTHALIPLFALAYVLLDTGAAILRRWLRGVPLARPDRRHVHHQLGELGLSPAKSVFIICLVSAGMATLGVVATFAPPRIILAATLAGVAGLCVIVGLGLYWLGYHEFLEAGSSIASALRNARAIIQDKINARDIAKLIDIAESLEEVEAILEDSAQTFRFADLRLSDKRSRFSKPLKISEDLQTAKVWKFEYPILTHLRQEWTGLFLTIWCPLDKSPRSAGAERVAQILAPRLATWAERVLMPAAAVALRVVPPEPITMVAGSREAGSFS